MLEGTDPHAAHAESASWACVATRTPWTIETYANRLPDDLSAASASCWTRCWPPATPSVAATNYLFERGAKDVTCVCILAAPEGIKTLEEAIGDRADVNVVVAAVDDHLNEKSYIVPGLGDAGDRLYGIID